MHQMWDQCPQKGQRASLQRVHPWNLLGLSLRGLARWTPQPPALAKRAEELHLDSNRRIISSANFLKKCRGAGTRGSPPIHTFFKPTSPTRVKTAATPELETPASTGPRPKRLHFSTPLTAREDADHPAQAMTPSQLAGDKETAKPKAPPRKEPPPGCTLSQPETPEEESQTDDEMDDEAGATFNVDYF